MRQQLPAFRRGQEWQVRDALLRIGDDGFEQSLELSGHALDRRCVEQIGGIFEESGETTVGLDQFERDVESRHLWIDLDPPRRQAGETCRLDRCVLEDEHDPEQRIAVAPARDLKRAQDFLYREVLVAVGIERDLPHPSQHVAEARIAAEMVAQDQGVGEQPDQPLALDLVTVGDQRSRRDILVSGVAEQ
ncbi:hypothetical protein ACVWWG_004525 [Bradyrhizobium sp. LB7.2]